MGKDLKGKELGTGLRQRKDGRYEARAKINGIDINLYDVDLKKLKILFEKAKEEARNNIDNDTLNIQVPYICHFHIPYCFSKCIIIFATHRKHACFLDIRNFIICKPFLKPFIQRYFLTCH